MTNPTLSIFPILMFFLLASCGNQNSDKENQEETSAIEWYEPEDLTPREQCPCCDYISLPERGNYLICPICFWEDDGHEIDELDVSSGPNHGITLREGRANFAEFGACEIEMVKFVLSEEERMKFERVIRDIE